jgi:hypothetical protein
MAPWFNRNPSQPVASEARPPLAPPRRRTGRPTTAEARTRRATELAHLKTEIELERARVQVAHLRASRRAMRRGQVPPEAPATRHQDDPLPVEDVARDASPLLLMLEHPLAVPVVGAVATSLAPLLARLIEPHVPAINALVAQAIAANLPMPAAAPAAEQPAQSQD